MSSEASPGLLFLLSTRTWEKRSGSSGSLMVLCDLFKSVIGQRVPHREDLISFAAQVKVERWVLPLLRRTRITDSKIVVLSFTTQEQSRAPQLFEMLKGPSHQLIHPAATLASP